MKVKIFSVFNPLGRKGKNQLAFESQINEWLTQNPKIEILRVEQSASGGSFYPSLWLITIWFKEL
jgi:hypothetical protein